MKESLNPEGVVRVQNRAAAILADAGQVEDAAAIYREAQNWERYISLILKQAQALVKQGRSETLSEWLAAVPKRKPLSVLDRACALLRNPVESKRYFERAF
jgi:hypothetical protein